MVKCFVMIFTKNHAKTGYIFVTNGGATNVSPLRGYMDNLIFYILQTCRPYGAIRIILFFTFYKRVASRKVGTGATGLNGMVTSLLLSHHHQIGF